MNTVGLEPPESPEKREVRKLLPLLGAIGFALLVIYIADRQAGKQ